MGIRASAVCALCSMVSVSAASASSFFFSNEVGLSNVDRAGGVSQTLVVSSVGDVTDLNFFIDLSNSRSNVFFPGTMAWGNLNVSLSKDGIEVLLWADGPPGETPRLYVALDDQATEGVSLNEVLQAAGGGQAFTMEPNVGAFDPDNVGASYLPLEGLAAFNGVALNGVWTLTFLDDVEPDEGDKLTAWGIYGTSTAHVVPLPGGLPLLASGLIAASLIARKKRNSSRSA